MKLTFLLCILTILSGRLALGQVADAPDADIKGIPVNYTEAKVGTYSLPDPLKLADGQTVADADTWLTKRRPEIVRLYEENQFGRIPATAPKVTWEVVKTDSSALDGKAVMKQLAGHMGSADGPAISATLYTPAGAGKPAPVLVSISFNFAAGGGRLRTSGPTSGPASAPMPRRGTPAELISRGFASASIIYNSIETDVSGQPNVNVARKLALAPDQTSPANDEWGAIGAWAWGISGFVDHLQTEPGVDAKRIAITGVSRLGKTVLWAAARDTRIALVIASCSGEGGGSALSRRNYGETIKHLVEPTRYPYQFCANYGKYADHVDQFPVDGHMLISLIAPRPVLLQTGDTDRWSDPKGEFLAAVAAGPVYKLLGKQGLETDTMPQANQPILHTIGYFMHAGGHGTVPSDWDQYFAFMRMHLQP